MRRPQIELSSVVLGARDPGGLARFYERLLGWRIAVDEGDWLIVREPSGGTGLSFQLEADHVPPVWPAGGDDQQMQIHLDIGVDDLAGAVEWAIGSGARLAAHQPQTEVRVMIDPEGHPFCLFPAPFGD